MDSSGFFRQSSTDPCFLDGHSRLALRWIFREPPPSALCLKEIHLQQPPDTTWDLPRQSADTQVSDMSSSAHSLVQALTSSRCPSCHLKVHLSAGGEVRSWGRWGVATQLMAVELPTWLVNEGQLPSWGGEGVWVLFKSTLKKRRYQPIPADTSRYPPDTRPPPPPSGGGGFNLAPANTRVTRVTRDTRDTHVPFGYRGYPGYPCPLGS